MTKEQAMAMLKAKRECIELDTNGNAELCDRNCGECKLNYEQGNISEQKEALNIAIKSLEQNNEEIFKQFKKKVFLETEDVLGNEMVDSYMITDYLAELLEVVND